MSLSAIASPATPDASSLLLLPITLDSFAGSSRRVCKNCCILCKGGAGTGALPRVRLGAASDAVVDTNAACCRAGRALRVFIVLVSKMGASKAASSSCCDGNAAAPGIASLLASPLDAVTRSSRPSWTKRHEAMMSSQVCALECATMNAEELHQCIYICIYSPFARTV